MIRSCIFVAVAALGCSQTSATNVGAGPGVEQGDDPSAGDGAASEAAADDDAVEDPGQASEPHDGVCEEHGVRSDRITPDMLIVLDRSGSMSSGENGGVDRWGGSVQGIKAITSALEDSVNFGLMTFPSQDLCGAGRLDVEVAHHNASAIAQALDGMMPGGATPTHASLTAARDALEAIVPGPDEVARPKYVLLVTDGAPNCEDGTAAAGPNLLACLTAPDPLQCVADAALMAASQVDGGAVDATVDEIAGLAAAGIDTYVIGYNTKAVPNLAGALDRMAAAGGTGDTAHRAVEDQAGIVQEFEAITGVAVSCEFVLDEAPSDPIFVLVTLDGEQLNFGDPNGWTLSEDGRKVTVQGDACSDLQTGARERLRVAVQCEQVVPI